MQSLELLILLANRNAIITSAISDFGSALSMGGFLTSDEYQPNVKIL